MFYKKIVRQFTYDFKSYSPRNILIWDSNFFKLEF
jgi:hypothetical protein